MSIRQINTTVKVNMPDGKEPNFKSYLLMAGDGHSIAAIGQSTHDGIATAVKALAKLAVIIAPPTEDKDWAWSLASEIIESIAEAEAEREKRKSRWNKADDKRIEEMMDKAVNSARLNRNKPEIHCPYCEATIEPDESEAEEYLDGGFQTCPECGKEFYLESAEKCEWTTRQLDDEGNPLIF